MADLYAVLGVPPNASDEDIRRAYRMAARRLHPDLNTHSGAALQFREITGAHETLSDPVTRANYDMKRRQAGQERQYFSLRVTPSSRTLQTLSEPQVLYLLLEMVPDRSIDRRQTTAPLNLTLIIDRSTSMNGPRLERTKIAAHQIIDQLSQNDVLSVVMFSDRAEILIKAMPLADKAFAKTLITTMQASGGTEIFHGLTMGWEQNLVYQSPNFINHMILITDGRTYGDEALCLALADKAAVAGVGISAMGIGDEWNDQFLDQLAGRTGGTSQYISSPNAVVRFLNDKVKTLGQSLAERMTLSIAPDPDIKIESAFRLMPSAQPLIAENDPVPLGQMQNGQSISVLLQLQLPALTQPGFRSVVRLVAGGDIFWDQRRRYEVVADTSVEVSPRPPEEEPPLAILDALGKLTLYRMQQKAAEAASAGEVREATRRLEALATRLLAAGQEELANAAMAEARRMSSTNSLSDEGQKALKYGTRMLLLAAPTKDS